jgi:hypothetical protein
LSKKLRDFEGLAAFDLAAMQHIYGLAVLEQGHGWRRRRIGGQNIAQVGDSCFIAARENGSDLRGSRRMVQCQTYRGAGSSSRTTTDRIDDHQDGTTAGCQKPVDVGGSASLLDTVTGEVGTHGSDENFGIGHDSILAGASSAGPARWDCQGGLALQFIL